MKGKAIAGFVLTLVSLVCSSIFGMFISFYCYVIALPMAIVGLCLSASAGSQLKAAGQSRGLAVAGLVLGIIATVFGAITFTTCGLCQLCSAAGSFL